MVFAMLLLLLPKEKKKKMRYREVFNAGEGCTWGEFYGGDLYRRWMEGFWK